MKKDSNGISAYMVKKKNGNLYKIPGTIININESQQTADMSFINKDGKETIVKNISQKEIFINEDFRDSVRNFGSRVVDTAKKIGAGVKNFFKMVVERIGKFLLPKMPNGDLDGQGLAAFVNVAACPSPKGVEFIPSENLQEINGSIPQRSIEDCINDYLMQKGKSSTLTESVKSGKYLNEDVAEIHKYWFGFMDYVNEHKDKSLKENMRAWKTLYEPLNETIKSLSVSDDYEGVRNVHTPELMSAIEESVRSQRMNRPGETSNGGRVLMIWGAPGIGKTSIVKKAGKFVAESSGSGHGMSLILVNSAAIMPDTFQLPSIMPNLAGNNRIKNVPNNWLPMYEKSDEMLYMDYEDPETGEVTKEEIGTQTEYLDYFYNTGLLPDKSSQSYEVVSSGKALNDGGIIFFDEFSRMLSNSKNIIMSIVLDRALEGKVLASHWAMIGAANRKSDMSVDVAEDFHWEDANKTRFEQVNYVPTKEEWLEWATSETYPGSGEPNVDPIITNFLSSAEVDDGIWYDALDFNSREDDLKKSGLEFNGGKDASPEDVDAILSDNRFKEKLTSWNPRTWTGISDAYRNQYKYLMGLINPEQDNDPYQSRIGKLRDRLLSKGVNLGNTRVSGFSGELANTRNTPERVSESLESSLLEAEQAFDPETGAVNLTSGQFTTDSKYVPSKEELERRWANFYDKNYKICDPGMELKKYTEANVKQFLLKWVQNCVIPRFHGAGTRTEKAFAKYNEFLSVFTKAQLSNIWNRGTMELINDEGLNKDDFAADNDFFRKDPDLIWKANFKSRGEVLDLILSNYPGSLDTDLKQSLKTAASYKDTPLSETLVDEATFNKWVKDLFTFKIINVDKKGAPKKNGEKEYSIAYIAKDCNLAEEGAYSMFTQVAESKYGKSAEAFNTLCETKPKSELTKNTITIYSVNNLIDMLEKGDKFLFHIINYIKYMTKVSIENSNKGNIRVVEYQLIGNTDEIFKDFGDDFAGQQSGAEFDFASVQNNLFNKVLGNDTDLLTNVGGGRNNYMYYLWTLKYILRAADFIFTEIHGK